MAPGSVLTEAQRKILQKMSASSDVGKLAKSLGMAPTSLGMEIARLQLSGYVGEDGLITEKGLREIR